MDERNSKYEILCPEEIEIPQVFKTSIYEDFFRTCIVCGDDFIESENDYLIEKIFNKGEVEIEYSICLNCLEEERKKLSEESLSRVDKFFKAYESTIYERSFYLSRNHSFEDYIKKCLIRNKVIDNNESYHLMAHCRGTKLVLSVYPYVISEEVVEELESLLSQKTRDELDDFSRRYFDLQPDVAEILKRNVILL